MVDNSRTEILKKLDNIKSLEKKDLQLFKKLSKKYPVFIPFKIINLILSKKYNTLDYAKNLEICARQISDRNYLYEIVQNRILNENQKFEILKDLKEKSHDNQKSFIDWIRSTKPLIKNEGLSLGTSCGINIAGAIRLGKELGPGNTIVTILCDKSDKYASKMFNKKFLDEKGLNYPDWIK